MRTRVYKPHLANEPFVITYICGGLSACAAAAGRFITSRHRRSPRLIADPLLQPATIGWTRRLLTTQI